MGFMIGRSLAAVTETEILFYTDRGFSRGMCAALKYWTGLVRVRMTSIKGYQSPAKPRTKNTMQRINAKTWQLDYTDRTGGRAIRVHEAGESYVATGKTPDGHIHTTSQNGARSAFWKMVTKMKEQVIFPDTFSFPEGFLEGKDANIENDESNDNLEYSTISMGSDKDSDGAFED